MVVLLKSNKFWIAVLGAVLVISVIAVYLLLKTPVRQAKIYKNGLLISTINLETVNEPYSFTVESGSDVNVISVERGRICISESNCPGNLCTRQGWSGDGMIPIVCLPHNLVIKLEGSNAPTLDAVVGFVNVFKITEALK